MTRLIRVGAAVIAAVILTGCSSTPTAAPEPAPTVTLLGEAPTVAEPSSSGQPPPAVDAVTDPAGVAILFMTAFAQTDLTAADWYAGIAVYLTVYSQTAYQGTDPSRVTAHQVTGPATVLDGGTDRAIQVDVPTDAGTFRVQLSRYVASEPWQVDRAIPPASE